MSVAPHSVTLASAGTGKTHRLSGRYIALLLRGAQPREILATTFTRKAAGEILSRVLERLVAAAAGGEALERLRQSVAREGVTEKLTARGCAELACGLARDMDRVCIGTLDAFFARIAGSCAMELGVPPGWKMATEEKDRHTRDHAVIRALRARGPRHALALIRMLAKGDLARSVLDVVRRAVENAHGIWKDVQDPHVWSAIGPRTPPPSDEEFAQILRRFTGLSTPMTAGGKPSAAYQTAHDKSVRQVQAREWQEFIGVGVASALLQGKAEYRKMQIPADWAAAYTEMIGVASAFLLDELRRENEATWRVVKDFDEAYAVLKQASGEYRFDDVADWLATAGAADNLEHLYYRLDARLSHVLLDEFQDTSRIQFRVLTPLLDEVVAHGDGSRSMLVVGDVKQSLYGWRGAEPEILGTLADRWPGAVSRDGLHENWRSSPVVLSLVNRVFLNLDSNRAILEASDAAEAIAAASELRSGFVEHAAAKRDLPGECRLVAGPDTKGARQASDEDGEEEAGLDLAEFLAERAAAIANQCPHATVGVLLRRNMLAARIVHALRARGIDAGEEAGNPLTDSAAAAAAISALRLAVHPSESASALHAAAGPMGKVLRMRCENGRAVGADAASRSIREQAGRLGIAGMIEDWRRRLGPVMTADEAERFMRLVELAGAYERDGGWSLAEFARFAAEKSVDRPGGARVRVMTIHKAKGLEFDAVLLGEACNSWRVRSNGVLTMREGDDPRGSVVAASRWCSTERRALHPMLGAMYSSWRRKDLREELCGLYVGLTRARRLLEVVVHPDGVESPFSAARLLCCELSPGAAGATGDVLWQDKGDGRPWWQGIEPTADARAAGAHSPVKVTLREPDRHAADLPRRAPSGLEGEGMVRPGELFRPRGESQRRRGTLVHRWFQLVEWIGEADPRDDSLLRAGVEEGWSEEEAKEEIALFRAVLAGPIGDALRRRDADESVLREWPFAIPVVRDGEGEVLLTGQVDRLVLRTRDGRPRSAVVLDFKTDAVETEDQILQRTEHYAPQLRAYGQAVAAAFGLESRLVELRLLFTGPGRVVEVSPAG